MAILLTTTVYMRAARQGSINAFGRIRLQIRCRKQKLTARTRCLFHAADARSALDGV